MEMKTLADGREIEWQSLPGRRWLVTIWRPGEREAHERAMHTANHVMQEQRNAINYLLQPPSMQHRCVYC
jgi:hypothetical protein